MVVGSERRKHDRFEVPVRMHIEQNAPDEAIRARAVNVSDGGAMFVSPSPPPVGQALQVRLAVPRETANTFFLEQFAARARVVRHAGQDERKQGTRVALEFERPLQLDLP